MTRPALAVVHCRRSGQVLQLAPKRARRLVSEGNGNAGGAGDGARFLVDLEVVEVEATGDCRAQGRRLDDRRHGFLLQVVTELPGAVGGVAQHLGAFGLVLDEVGGGGRVGGGAGGEVIVGDQAGLGLDGHMGLEPVPVGVGGLWAWRDSGSTVEMTRSGAVRWAMRQVPATSPGSTSWPATRASRATAAACFSLRSRSSAAHTSSLASSTSSEIRRSMSAGSSQSQGGRPPSRLCSRTHTESSSGTSFRTRRRSG